MIDYDSDYDEFRFIDWKQVGNELHFNYAFDDEIQFTEKLIWPQDVKLPQTTAFHRAADAYHLLAGVSYYKAHLAPKMVVESQDLTEDQAEFLSRTYLKGLGEFLYTNELDPALIAKFEPTTHESTAGTIAGDLPLVLIGGGKDSLVSVGLLQAGERQFETFRVNTQSWVSNQMKQIGAPAHTLKRVLDPELFAQNEQGALNGHVPVTAIVSMAAVLQAAISKNSAVIVSNEASANIPNTEYQGLEINHQYSKTLEAEIGLAKYVRQNIASDLEYFSLLRPWTELRIAEYFAKNIMANYPKMWSSSNHNFKIGEMTDEAQWDPYSPKSLSIFGMLSAFIPREELFKELRFNGFNDEVEDMWAQLLGISGIKPFECVADIDEMRLALHMAQTNGNWPELTDFDIPEVLIDDYTTMREHRIPDAYIDLVPSSI